MRTPAAVLFIVIPMVAASAPPGGADEPGVIDHISADSLRGHLSFIASDLLGGRDTPSPGLDIAAEYIAAQFRRAGLEPAGDAGYFQTAAIESDAPGTATFAGAIRVQDGVVEIDANAMSVVGLRENVEIENARVIVLPFPLEGEDHNPEEIESDRPLIIVTDMPAPGSVSRADMRAYFGDFNRFTERADELGAAAIVLLDPSQASGRGPDNPGRAGRMVPISIISLHGEEIAARFGYDGETWDADITLPTLDLRYTLPEKTQTPVRNVAAILRGSDPRLADEFIIVSAHYDHVGRGAAVAGDDIYNGANDDGSGTVSVIEIASTLARLKPEDRPRRSILFLCVYGEERGLQGSRHYIQNPIVPLEKTIANINLEHLGRTDDTEGPSEKRLMPTGFDYSTAIEPFVRAGEELGVEVFHHPRNSASFFSRSDNAAFARAGIPAHSFCTAFIFPDYHGAGDHWDKIDYENMAAVNRVIAIGLIRLANADDPPEWTEGHRATERYIETWNELHGLSTDSD